MNVQRAWRRAWWRRLRILVLPACALALAFPASAPAVQQQDLRSPDARDAARAEAPVRIDERTLRPAPTNTLLRCAPGGASTGEKRLRTTPHG